MQLIKEYLLNGLLAVLVVASVVLSMRIWFPTAPATAERAKEAHVQSSPPSEAALSSPDLFRPERIYVQGKEGQVAVLGAGSTPYKQIWHDLKDVLVGMKPFTAPMPTEEEPPDKDRESITLVLPLSQTLWEWIDEWKWSTVGLRNYTMKIDRLTIYLDKAPMIHLAGAAGVYRIGPVPEADLKLLRDMVAQLDPALYRKYRPLALKDPGIRLSPTLTVPDVADMPLATLEAKLPDQEAERIRYFPDLSVVRQIDEKEASSFTDGVRLLRLTSDGRLDYSMAYNQGVPPELNRQVKSAVDSWVGAHGGWPQELVLSDYYQQVGRSTLVYDLRMDGVFPVESAAPNNAMRVEVTRESGTDTIAVTQYRRIPEFIPHFHRSKVAIISAEKALQLLAAKSLLLQSEEVREMHLAYLVNLSDVATGTRDWLLEPVWVVQAGEKRAYVPASALSPMKPFVSGP